MYFLYFVHVLVCLFLILVVMVQQGKGADLSVFGGGATMTAFGARGATTILHKLTVGAFVTFILTTLGIAIVEHRSSGASVVRDLPAASAPVVPVVPAPLAPAAPSETAPATTPPAETPATPPPATPPPAN
jgi:preprotein translocase subunit SecG